MVLLAWVVAWTVALSVVDLRTRRLPTRMVWTMGLGLAILTVPEALAAPAAAVRMVVGAATSTLPLAVLRHRGAGGMGGGDVRFAVPLGAVVGLRAGSVADAHQDALVGLLVASVVALGVVVVRGLRGRGWSEPVAFGPCLGLGLLLMACS